jgi:hypothetical protein
MAHKVQVLMAVIVLAIIAWSGWWLAGRAAQQAALDGWLDARRADGWVADRDSLTVTGYPFRFDTRIDGLEIADPASGWAWSAPSFGILAQAYAPNDIRVFLPPQQTIASPGDRISIASTTMYGQVVFRPSTALDLDRTVIEMTDVALSAGSGWTAGLRSGLLAIRRAADGTAPGHAYDLHFDAADLTLPDGLRRLLDRTGTLPTVFSAARIDLTAAWDAPWDRHAIEGRNPRLTAASLRGLKATWGVMDLSARGAFTIAADGTPEGEIAITARHWRRMLQVATDAGLLDPDMAGVLETGLELASRFGGDPDSIEMPLVMSGGSMRLGPIPLGPAPRLARPAG